MRNRAVVFGIVVMVAAMATLCVYLLERVENESRISLERFRRSAYELRRGELRNIGMLAHALAGDYRRRAHTGELSVAEAQRRFLGRLHELRYDNGQGYFWVHELEAVSGRPPAMVMHPTQPALVGMPVSAFIDLQVLTGIFHRGRELRLDSSEARALSLQPVQLLEEANRLCRTQGDGVITYYWNKPSGNRVSTIGYPKMSYVRAIPEWNWVIGCGLYVDDIERGIAAREQAIGERAGETTRLALLLALAAALALLLMVWRVLAVRRELLVTQANLSDLLNKLDAVTTHISINAQGKQELRFVSERLAQWHERPVRDFYADTNLLRDMIHPDDRERVVALAEQQWRSGGEWQCEYRVRLPRCTRWMRSNYRFTPRPDGGGDMHVVTVDITERVLAETLQRKSEEQQRAVLAALPDLLFIVDSTGRFAAFHAPAETPLLLPRERIIGSMLHDVFPGPAGDTGMRLLQETLADGNGREWQYTVPIGGAPRHYEARFARMDEAHAVVLVRDVTALAAAREALQASERRFRELVELLPQGVAETDLQGRITFGTAPAFALFGYSPEDLAAGMHITDLLMPDERERIAGDIARVIQAGGSSGTEYRGRRKDGTELPFIAYSSVILQDGRPVGLRVLLVDNRERKKAELELRESERRFRLLFDEAVLGVFQTTMAGRFAAANPALARMFGYDSPSQMLADVTDVATQIYAEPGARARVHAELVNPGSWVRAEVLFRRRDGSTFWGGIHIRRVAAADGTVRHLEGFVEDVSRRRTAEEALRRSEEQFRTIFDNAALGISRTLPEGRYLMMNPAFARMFGFDTPEQMVREVQDIGMQLYDDPEDRKALLAEMAQAGGRWVYRELFLRRRDGSRFRGVVHLSRGTAEDGSGYIDGLVEDVQRRYEAEQEALAREQRLNDIIESLPDAALVLDAHGVVTSWNRAMEEMTGVRKEDIIGQGDHACTVPFYGERRPHLPDLLDLDDDALTAQYAQVRRTGAVLSAEAFCPALHGGQGRYIWAHVVPLYDRAGKRTGVIETIRDITESKRAADLLRESEEKFRAIVDNSLDGIAVAAPDGTINFANPMFCRMLGYPAGTMAGMPVSRLHPEDEQARVRELLAGIAAGTVRSAELRFQRRDGTVRIAEVNFTVFRLRGETLLAGSFRDITERAATLLALRESEEKFRALAENTSDVIMRFDREHRHIYVNPAIEAMSGRPPAEHLLRTHAQLGYPRELCEIWEREIAAVFADGRTRRCEFRLPNDVWVDWMLFPERGRDGSVMSVITAARDISAAKKTAMELERLHLQQRALLDNIPDMAWFKDTEGNYLEVNEAFLRACGRAEVEVLGADDSGLWPGELPQRYRADDLEVMRTRKQKRVEEPIVDADGTQRWIETIKTPIIDREGAVLGTVGLAHDITQRREMEQELRNAQRRLNDIIEFLPDATMVIDTAGRVIAWNRVMEKMTGVPKAEMLGRDNYAYALPFYGERRPILIDLVLQKLEAVRGRYDVAQFNGKILSGEVFVPKAYGGRGAYLSGTASALYDSAGRPTGAIEVIRDITEKRQALLALQENEEKYRTLVENIDLLVYRRTPLPDPVITYANPAALRVFGLRELPAAEQQHRDPVMRSIWSSNPETLAVAREAEEKGEARNREVRMRDWQGRERVLQVTTIAHRTADGEIDYVDVVGEDVTEARRLQQRMMQNDKLAALGRLSAAVAHEMNQPLNAVRSFCQDIVLSYRDGIEMSRDEVTFNLRKAVEQVDRLADIIRNMRVFVRQDGETVQERVPAARLLQYPLSLMGAQLRTHGIQIDCDIPDTALQVRGNEARLQQVFINLLTNARDAMSDGQAGERRIVLRAAADAERQHAVFTVRDTGSGIRADDLDKVFEPFFTTKGPDAGTGLGLAVSYEIVRQHNGLLTVQSEAGQGTVFTVTLPLAEAEA